MISRVYHNAINIALNHIYNADQANPPGAPALRLCHALGYPENATQSPIIYWPIRYPKTLVQAPEKCNV